MAERLAAAHFVLLGEKHDNPDHHRLQARLLQSLVRAGRRPALVLEMLEVEQQGAVDAFLGAPGAPPSATGFGEAVGWAESGWPPLSEYAPVLEVALAAKLPIVAGNFARDEARALVKEGLSALPAQRVSKLRLDLALPEPLESALASELRDSHCGHLPERLIAPMALAQRARDAQMAAVMVQVGSLAAAPSASSAAGAVLIAGAGHARRDRGVPYYLALDAPGAPLVSLALLEVQGAASEPSAYLDAPESFDYVWFTPRHSDEDPCAAFTKPAR